jgi:hypothetical protein
MRERAASVAAMFRSAGDAVVDSWTSAMDQVDRVVDGQMVTREKAFGEFLKNILKRAGEFLASSVITGLLKIIGGALAGGPFGVIASFLGFEKGGDVPKFAEGGDVSGGVINQDSRVIAVAGGEHMINADDVRDVKNGRPVGLNIGGTQAVVTSGAGLAAPVFVQQGAPILPPIQVHAGSLAPLDRADWERMIEQHIAPAFVQAFERGAIPVEWLRRLLGLV